MALLWRSNPRKVRGSWTAQLTQQRAASVGGAVAVEEFFGIIGTLATGQGSATSAITASIASASAPISTGQGSATTDAAFGVVSAATIDTGQGSATSDGVVQVPFIATIETGQGDATSDAVFGVVDFQGIQPAGFWDAANVTTHPGASFWRLNPRTQRQSLVSMLVQQEASQAFAAAAAAEQFTSVPFNTYADGFGAARATFAFQAAVPSGINDGAFGTAAVRNNTQYLVASGTAFQAFGLPTLYNLRQYITATGIASAQAFGTAGITNSQRFLTPTGVSSASAFGTAYVHDPSQYVTPTGAAWGAFGTGTAYNSLKQVSVTGTKFQAFGTAVVQNSRRTLFPVRIDPKGFGTATIIGPRYITATVGDASLFGLPVAIGPRTSLLQGFASAGYGTHWVSNSTRTVRPYDIEAPYHQVSLGAAVNDFTRYLFPTSIGDDNEFFGPVIGIDPFSVVEPQGLNDSAVGTATIAGTGADRRIRATGIGAGAVGTARTNPAAITGIGFSSMGFGGANISNYTRYLSPAGISSARYGVNWISNYRRYVDVQGFDKSVVWDDFGPIDENGKAARVYLADPTITVEMSGLASPGFGTASVRQTYGC